MKWIPNLKTFRLNRSSYDRAALAAMREFNKRAGKAWIRAAVDQTPIPTWSGASRATFQKLARELGTSVPIGPIIAPRSRVALGRSVSSGSGVVEEVRGGSPKYVGFTYETDLRYLEYNEYNRATKGPPPQPYSNAVRFTPYRFQQRAQGAWQVEASKARLPNPFNYVLVRKI